MRRLAAIIVDLLLRRNLAWPVTLKFFLGSRVRVLRQKVKQQKRESLSTEGAVNDLEGMWTAWRTRAYTGRVRTTGLECAPRDTVRYEAVRIYDRYFPEDAETREAFLRYLDRVGGFITRKRPSYYRKLAFGIFFETPTMTIPERRAFIEAKLSAEQMETIARYRAERQGTVLRSFHAAVREAIRDSNALLPEGKKVLALILLGSYATGEATPESDIDYQLVTQGGGYDAIPVFATALDERWTENRVETIEAFRHTLPPSRDLVRKSFLEGYRVISNDPETVRELSSEVEPPDPTRWGLARGKLFGWLYGAWVWLWFRAANIAEAHRSAPEA